MELEHMATPDITIFSVIGWMVDTYLHKRMQKDCYHLVKECSPAIYWQSVVISALRILVRQHSIRVSYTLLSAGYIR